MGSEGRVACRADDKDCITRDIMIYSRLPEAIGEKHVFSAYDDADAIAFASARRPESCGPGYLLRGSKRNRARDVFEADYIHAYKTANSDGRDGAFWYGLDEYRRQVPEPPPAPLP